MIVLDIETSGLSIGRCGIWQIGALEYENPKNQFLEEARIDDEDEVTEEAMKVTGKTEEELRDKKKQSQKQMIENFFKWTKSVGMITLICENPQFDFNFIEFKARKYGLKSPLHYKAFDLHSIASYVYFKTNEEFLIEKNHSGIGLSKTLEFCGMKDDRIKIKDGKIEKEGKPHNALEDAKLEAECFSRLLYGKNMFPEYSKFKIPEYLR